MTAAILIAAIAAVFDFNADCSAPINPLLVQIPQCVSYQGFQGGLYVGTNTRPAALNTKALAAISAIVPRDQFGNPEPNGSIVVLTVGQSYSYAVALLMAQAAEADPLKSPSVHFVDAALTAGSQEMADPSNVYWSYVDQCISNAGFTIPQVQVVWMMTTKLGTVDDPIAAFPQHALELEADILTIQDNLLFRYPNVAACYLSPRMTGRYGDPTSPLLPVPCDYEVGFADQWAIRDQTGPIYMDWAAYWYDQDVPCSYFGADGVHLSPSGAQFWGDALHRFFRDDRMAKRWYR